MSSRVNSIIGQLQDALRANFEGSLSGGPEFANQYPTDDDDQIDVPKTPETNYVTYRPFKLPKGTRYGNKLPFESKRIEEQGEDKKLEDEEASLADLDKEAGVETPDETAEPSTDVGADMGDVGGDMTGADMAGADLGMGGVGGFGMEQEEPKTAGQLGRIYELKKIYSRLTSIESYLGNESATELLEIRTFVSKAIELFEVVSANFDSYKDRLDEIIITYYKFIMEVYNEVKSHFEKESKSGD